MNDSSSKDCNRNLERRFNKYMIRMIVSVNIEIEILKDILINNNMIMNHNSRKYCSRDLEGHGKR